MVPAPFPVFAMLQPTQHGMSNTVPSYYARLSVSQWTLQQAMLGAGEEGKALWISTTIRELKVTQRAKAEPGLKFRPLCAKKRGLSSMPYTHPMLAKKKGGLKLKSLGRYSCLGLVAPYKQERKVE